MKSEKDYIIHGIASAISIVTAYLPNDMYILKIAGVIIFNIVIWKNSIKKLLSKQNKKKDEKLEK